MKNTTEIEENKKNEEALMCAIATQYCVKLGNANTAYSVIESFYELPSVPFKVYIYALPLNGYLSATQMVGAQYDLYMHKDARTLHTYNILESVDNTVYLPVSNTVIGEFMCSEVLDVKLTKRTRTAAYDRIVTADGVERDLTGSITEPVSYLACRLKRCGAQGKALRMTDLKLYARPLDISSFSRVGSSIECTYSNMQQRRVVLVHRCTTCYTNYADKTQRKLRMKYIAQTEAARDAWQRMVDTKSAVIPTETKQNVAEVTSALKQTQAKKKNVDCIQSVGTEQQYSKVTVANANVNAVHETLMLTKLVAVTLLDSKQPIPKLQDLVSIAEDMRIEGVYVA